MKVRGTELPGVLLVEPDRHEDSRGWFLETFQQRRYEEAGIPGPFVQDCLSRSEEGVLRGIHLQWPRPQGKLVYVLEGEVLDVAVDLRRGSPTFRRWVAHTLTGPLQVFVPPGFGHGFLVRRGPALLAYKCSDVYHPASEATVRWDDPDLGIAWGIEAPVLSAKDAAAPVLSRIPRDRLPRCG
jgi:dTDP-4-dehydrorhamnose 3,5-epimerase